MVGYWKCFITAAMFVFEKGFGHRNTFYHHLQDQNCDFMGQNQSHVAFFSYRVKYTSSFSASNL